MFFAHVKGLGFVRFLSVDGGQTQQVFFTNDFENATCWRTAKEMHQELNGDIAGKDLQVLKIEVV